MPSRGIFNWPRQTASKTPDEVTIEAGHWGHDLSSAPDMMHVWTNLGIRPTPDTGPRSVCNARLPAASVRLLDWGFQKGAGSPEHTSVVALLHIFIRQFESICVSTSCANQMFLHRMSYSVALFTVRSSSVCQVVGSANSAVICMSPWYIFEWLSDLKPVLESLGLGWAGWRAFAL